MPDQTLFEKYGGFGSINRVVMAFYDALLDSDDLGPYFDDIDIKRLIDHQTKFISSIMGGPASYTDEQLGKAHTGLGVTDAHFDELKVILAGILEQFGIEAEDIETLLVAIEARRPVIVL